MRVIVVSDTHQDLSSLMELVKRHQSADLFIHLGDGLAELQEVQQEFPDMRFLSVSGNCDRLANSSLAGCLSLDQAKIFYTHGHMYDVKYSLDKLFYAAMEMQANVVLFGHTHIPLADYKHSMHIMNPGSLGMPRGLKPSYGILDITGAGIVCHISTFDSIRK